VADLVRRAGDPRYRVSMGAAGPSLDASSVRLLDRVVAPSESRRPRGRDYRDGGYRPGYPMAGERLRLDRRMGWSALGLGTLAASLIRYGDALARSQHGGD